MRTVGAVNIRGLGRDQDISCRMLAQSCNVPLSNSKVSPFGFRRGDDEGVVTMSHQEVDRLGVIQPVAGKQLRQRDAARQLGMGVRRFPRHVPPYWKQPLIRRPTRP